MLANKLISLVPQLGHAVAQLFEALRCNRKVAGSIPDEANIIFL